MTHSNTDAAILLTARIFLAAIFLISGFSKLPDPQSAIGYMTAFGIPALAYWPATIFEISAGALILTGYRTSIVAYLLAGFCLLTGLVFHHNFADQIQQIMFLKNVALAGGFLALAAVGSGHLGVDGRA